MRRRVVLHLITSLRIGGAERALQCLAPRLRRRGWEPRFLTLEAGRGEVGALLARAGFVVESCGMRHRRDLLALARLPALIARHRPPLVQTHLFHPGVVGRVAARLAGVRRVISTLWVVEGRRQPLRLALDTLTARLADAHVAISDSCRRWLVRRAGVPATRVFTIRYAVDPAPFALADGRGVREELGLVAGRRMLLCVARLHEQKGCDRLLRAFARLVASGVTGWTLVIAGDGPERQRLLALAAPLGARVVLCGARQDVPRLMAAADRFALASRWEGSPLALVEAALAGLPALGPDLPGVREIMPDETYGLLAGADAAPRAAAGGRPGVVGGRTLDDALRALLEMPDPEARARAVRARALALLRFNPDRQADALCALYETLIT